MLMTKELAKEYEAREGFKNQAVLSQVKEVRETTDTKEVARLLSSGNWIATFATSGDTPMYVMGRV